MTTHDVQHETRVFASGAVAVITTHMFQPPSDAATTDDPCKQCAAEKVVDMEGETPTLLRLSDGSETCLLHDVAYVEVPQ